ncbi:hypothetical protein [Leisingera sp. F5]|uniref:hypothetical protein n=1 Tax=Leisingera sp. F5 TaxID=1813816 RepID=UPI000A5DFEAF|nr:hypothetical protein [Leisingera sp. F5]
MRKIRDVLRLSAEGLPARRLAASPAIGRTTLQGYLERAQEAVLSRPLPPEMSDTDLEQLLYSRITILPLASGLEPVAPSLARCPRKRGKSAVHDIIDKQFL